MKQRNKIFLLVLSQLLISVPIFASTGSINVKYVDHERATIKEERIEKSYGKISIFGRAPVGYKIVGENKQDVEITEENPNDNIEFDIEDIQAPKGKGKSLTLNLGEKASPSDFVKDITDNSDRPVDISFKNDIDFNKEGRQSVKVILTDYNGNIANVSASLTIVNTKDAEIVDTKGEYGKKMNVSSFINGKLPIGLTAKFENEPNMKQLGNQKVVIILSGGKEPIRHTVTLNVSDTVAPKGKIKTETIDIEARLSAIDLVENVEDNTGGKVEVYFKQEPKWGEFGRTPVVITLRDESGNTTDLKGSVTIENKDAITAEVREVTTEAGKKVDPKRFLMSISNSQDSDISYATKPNFEKVGKQSLTLDVYDKRGFKTELKVTLNVVDTTNPKATLKTKEITIPLKGRIDVNDYIEEVTDNSDGKISISFEDKPDVNTIGEQKLKIIISDPSKNEMSYRVILKVIDPIDVIDDKSVTILISPLKGTYSVQETKKQLKMDSAPILENGRVLVPVSNIARVLNVPDGNIEWDAVTKKATITKTDIITKKEYKVSFNLGSDIVNLNGYIVQMDVPAKAINGRTYVPLKYAMDGLGITNYKWDSENKQVVINLENLNDEMYKIYK